jgi:hypothetical protein
MNAAQSAAYVFAQSVAALAEIAGMHAENQWNTLNGGYPIYRDDSFKEVIDCYAINRAAVLRLFEEAGP